MRYEIDEDIKNQLETIATLLGFKHIDFGRTYCVRSFGSSSRRTLARCHTISKVIQTALSVPAFYAIEIVSENFNRLPEEEKTRTLIHELLHIPRAFGGGFRQHSHVNRKTVEYFYREFSARSKQQEKLSGASNTP